MPAPVQPFGLVFADPPYGKGLGEQALHSASERRLAGTAAAASVEEAASVPFRTGSRVFALLDERNYGETVIRFLEAA